MQNTSSKAGPIILVIVIVLAVAGYFLYTSGNQTVVDATGKIAALAGGGSAAAADNGVGADVLLLLNRIQSIKIDPSIFNDPAYQSLVDYTVAIPTWNVGRDNPFAPLPGSTVTPSPASGAPARR
ncbi:hypothetical protein EB052_00170 [bacterium]|nr:hypothetical protein [bacterium]